MKRADARDGKVYYWCPACRDWHAVAVGPPYKEEQWWSWEGGEDFPTFSPSVKVRHQLWNPRTRSYDILKVCHHYVERGRIRYLGDCTHAMAGQRAEIPPWADHRPARSPVAG